jgi:hypothetical protein
LPISGDEPKKHHVGANNATMKTFAVLAAILAAGFSSSADSVESLDRFSPQFSAKTEILWRAPTNHLPKSFWIYKRLPPRPFSAVVISNAIILASLQSRGFPKPSTNAFFIWSAPNPCGMSYSIFSIQPASMTISFSSTNQKLSTDDIPGDEIVTKRAFECASRFGLSQADLIPKNIYFCSNALGCDETLTNNICGRGISLSRKVDGFGFYGDAESGSGDGFSIEFGSHGQIRSFSLMWPLLEPYKKSATATPKEIIRCIREHKVMLAPAGESDYFGQLKQLDLAQKFTITKITPYYGEGRLGEMPANDTPPKYIAPVAELEAVADYGNFKVTGRLLAPIVSSEVARLREKEAR